MTATVKLEPARVHDLLLFEEGALKGDQRYCRRQANFKNKDTDHAAIQASGTLNVTSPTGVIALAAQSGGAYADEAGNLGAITLDVVDGVSEGVAYDPDTKVLTVTVNITGASHNTVTLMNAVLNASANWVSSVTSGGAGTITGATAGTATLAGGQAAVAVQTSMQIGQALVFVTDHYEPVTQANESSAVAVLLVNIDDLTDDEVVDDVQILHNGPAMVNLDQMTSVACDPYTSMSAVATALAALTPFGIDTVREPVNQSTGSGDD